MGPVSFLLVDDLEENLLSLEALLRREGLNLLKARSGDEALELLLEHDVALALVDVQMPGLNGFELAELMRGNERTRRVPIIFVTAGSGDSQRRFQGYEAGAVDFIQKPIEADILRSKAEVFFELYRQRQQIAAQRDELKVQAEALREADRRKDEFLATLAHELRNPLAPLRNGVEVLRRNPEGDNGKIVEVMDRQLAHLVRLVDDLLDVARVSQGKIELRKATVKVDDVVHDAVEAVRPLLEAAGHSLALDFPGEAIWVDADRTRLSQVIANLLNNAAKYTPEDGQISISVRADEGDVFIDVTDNGIGIPPDMQAAVFQLFAQVGSHLDRAKGGLGIGLALVRQLVTMHGGIVEARSNGVGQGSVFSVQLPMGASPEPVPAQPADDTPDASPKILKVLVVDDNADVGFTTGMMLEEMGYQFELAQDGNEALEFARSFRPDAILLDIGLPGADGYQVCRTLRQEEMFKSITIIAQTGWGREKDKELAYEAGFDHHLTKPVAFGDLQELLSGVSV